MSDLLRVSDFHVKFATIDGPVHVLRGVDLAIGVQERVAVVGESGSGKSVTARAILGLLPASKTQVSGSIIFQGAELTRLSERKYRALRGRAISMIFQDPTAALSPVFPVRSQLRRIVARDGGRLGEAAIEEKMRQALVDVSIADPERVLDSYSFQLSGGLNQRVMIAASLMNRPSLLIADEPGTALDATVQEQSLRVMERLSEAHGTAILFISHNLGVVRRFAHRVYVMYAGRIVEAASTAEIFTNPRHPYTRLLLASVPRLGSTDLPLGIEGSIPDYHEEPAGCPFIPRCPAAIALCTAPVVMRSISESHSVACVSESAQE
ncbi:ABC transporter ATP-binding protein [Pseudorhodoplanes sp.]|uniref:ABC transporter ATP-binding protein n=1 Tax=Pseudorhodoplanes sp. TaxID=1934341 RepID=UPI003D0BAC60